ncbi:MAG: hypothetical protein HOF74_14890 [Gammaproteobacteria bacterium]|jgi:hypothetical protein|nr:hypothetical protein [Gammaproteobacteria bacterium]MBT3861115.1 hypothetical protein [Gammaproteobacteria bacterium]MBT3987675.1 hypothetical protein [Gammaproteobacteria bacterium]MBT4257391.1 hypothetical protein [Gammaproteobacteria bacterium]MBT4582745.1 hypothetical protein [Gammaproteobacteria bacterium]
MQISSRERNILILAGLVAAIFIATSIFPAIGDVYQGREDSLDSLRLDIEREQRLIANTADWRERRVSVELAMAELEAQTFDGETVPIVEANIQSALSLHARDSGITVSSTRLAETLETDGWLLISQEMSYRTTDQANTVAFLEKLEQSLPRLRVTDFNVNRSRNQYSGSITVVGFTRSEGLLLNEAEEQ